MSALDFDRLRRTQLTTQPFSFIIVPGFVKAEALAAIHADYPKIRKPGSFPMATVRSGPAFKSVVAELEGPEMRRAIEEKFGLDLSDRPTMLTVRGYCRADDGDIHTDTDSKIITCLIYFNGKWDASGGRLRLLRSAHDIEDMVAEVPPDEGTLLAFRRSNNSFHGHKSFEGQRRAIQLNWVTSRDIVRREMARHHLAALTKTLNPFG